MTRIVAYSRNGRPHSFRQFKGEAKTYTIDLSRLEAELGETVATTAWEVEVGGVSITNEDLTSSILTADITTSQTGKQLIKLACNTASQTHVIYIAIKVNDPKGMSKDYC